MTAGDSGNLSKRGGVPWWLVLVLGAALTASVGVTSYVAQGLIAMRLDLERHTGQINRNVDDIATIRGQIATLPTSKDFERLSLDMNNLRDDLRELRRDLKERKPTR